jgi:hypothetical protein
MTVGGPPVWNSGVGKSLRKWYIRWSEGVVQIIKYEVKWSEAKLCYVKRNKVKWSWLTRDKLWYGSEGYEVFEVEWLEVHIEVQVQQSLTVHISLVLLFSVCIHVYYY